jgi:glycosyltransferase involved in cell wall biosynthesis
MPFNGIVTVMPVLLLLVTCVIELAIYLPVVWRIRVVWSMIAISATSAATSALVVSSPSLLTAMAGIICALRLFNMMRVAENRLHATYLYQSALRTSLWACGTLAGTLLVGKLPAVDSGWLFLALCQLVVAALLLVSTLRTLAKTRPRLPAHYLSDKELPTVTVAIPARNETQDLADCLQSVLASDYAKLEIIVLDDCSQDKTPAIIKSFAHDGVRFIQGAEPGERWLAKNKAYQRLYEESTGELIIFCGVEARFGPGTVRTLVNTLLSHDKLMLSCLPLTADGGHFGGMVLQSVRYWWELALPRRYVNRPAVLSTAWMIRRSALEELGGFAAVSRTIVPESYFARELTKRDGYSFLRAYGELELFTAKTSREEYQTAIRVLYPQLHRRPELVFGLVLLLAVFLLGPMFMLFAGLVDGVVLSILGVISLALLLCAQLLIVRASGYHRWALGGAAFPLVVLMAIWGEVISMWRYEFSVIDWKGRNICLPVMRVEPRLPPLKD